MCSPDSPVGRSAGRDYEYVLSSEEPSVRAARKTGGSYGKGADTRKPSREPQAVTLETNFFPAIFDLLYHC